MSSVSVVVLHHDKAPYSRACLASLLGSTKRPLQVVNVDNGSRDETPEVLNEWEAQAEHVGITFRRLRFEENVGAVRGRNEALKLCDGELIAFLDNDTICWQADWLKLLSRFLHDTPDCALVCPKLLFPWAPFDIECCGAGVSPTGRIQYIGRGEPRESLTQPFPIQAAISAAWLMRRRVFEQIGALDEAFSPVQYEDIDFCYRARQAGFSLWADPRVEVFHFEHTTTAGSSDINFRYVTAKNALEFKRRWAQRFQAEDGPTDAQCRWREVERRTIEEVDVAALLPTSGVIPQ